MNKNELPTSPSPEELEKRIKKQSKFDSCFEKALWNCRFIVLLAVIFGLMSAIALFLLGSFEVVSGVKYFFTDGFQTTDTATLVVGAEETTDAKASDSESEENADASKK